MNYEYIHICGRETEDNVSLGFDRMHGMITSRVIVLL